MMRRVSPKSSHQSNYQRPNTSDLVLVITNRVGYGVNTTPLIFNFNYQKNTQKTTFLNNLNEIYLNRFLKVLKLNLFDNIT